MIDSEKLLRGKIILNTSGIIRAVKKETAKSSHRDSYDYAAIEELEDEWREWLEKTYASDIPEKLLDELYDRSQAGSYDAANTTENYQAIEAYYSDLAALFRKVHEAYQTRK